jgi:hypothetical protein
MYHSGWLKEVSDTWNSSVKSWIDYVLKWSNRHEGIYGHSFGLKKITNIKEGGKEVSTLTLGLRDFEDNRKEVNVQCWNRIMPGLYYVNSKFYWFIYHSYISRVGFSASKAISLCQMIKKEAGNWWQNNMTRHIPSWNLMSFKESSDSMSILTLNH